MCISVSITPSAESQTNSPGTKDGRGAGDHDQPFTFGQRASARAPFPFTPIEYAHLLVARGRVRDGLFGAADRSPTPRQPASINGQVALRTVTDAENPCFPPELGHPRTCRRCQSLLAQDTIARSILLDAGILAAADGTKDDHRSSP
ncbi:MAG: hypothetical protein JO352_17155 [Chloroflexi bacterium]|nr:hypothetical protein [Chloroflexota bacterium]